MAKIKSIKAREILDSKASPTVEVELATDKGVFWASVPSGVSKGKYEALELRDEGKRYGGRGVLKAVKNVNEIIGPKLLDKDPTKQKEMDELMIELDGTENKSKLGANAILPVSITVCRAGAQAKNMSLYQYIAQLSHITFSAIAEKVIQLPTPCLLMIEGGMHAGNRLDVQEFVIVPEDGSFSERLRIGAEIYQALRLILEKKFGKFATNVGFEGGFVAPLAMTRQALDLIVEAIDKAGYKDKARIVLDMAASTFFKDMAYQLDGMSFTHDGLLKFYGELIKDYPVLAIEDPFEQGDIEGFLKMTQDFGKEIFVVGDDFLVTNPERIKMAIKDNACNSLALKPNQIGTVTETLEAAGLAQRAGWQVFVKHRGGETNDDFLADLAVGLGAKCIMAGAPCRGERVAKYNRLLRIEEEIENEKKLK